MKPKKKPKIFFKKEIWAPDNKRQVIGQFLLVEYLTGLSPHIEFQIFEDFKEYRNKGIISKEIKKYLKLCKKHDYNKLIAVVKQDNLPSIKILEKNDFIKISVMDDNFCYMIDLKLTKDHLTRMQKLISQNYPLYQS